MSHIFLSVQCWRRLCSNPPDEGASIPRRSHQVDAASHLQVLVQHRRHLLPVRPAELQDEVWLMDLRPRQDRPDQHGQQRGPDGLLGEWRVGHRQRRGQVQHQEVRVLHRDLLGHHLLLHHPEASFVLHHQPHYPLSADLLSDGAGLLFALTVRRKDHLVYLSLAVPDRVPPADHRDHTVHVSGDSANRRILALHHGLRHALHHHHRLCFECAPPVAPNPWHAAVGAESLPGVGSQSPVHEASSWHGQAALQKAHWDDAPTHHRVCNRQLPGLLERTRDGIETVREYSPQDSVRQSEHPRLLSLSSLFACKWLQQWGSLTQGQDFLPVHIWSVFSSLREPNPPWTHLGCILFLPVVLTSLFATRPPA